MMVMTLTAALTVNGIYVNDGHDFDRCFDCVNGIYVNIGHDFAALTV